jgi:hypothetical protein
VPPQLPLGLDPSARYPWGDAPVAQRLPVLGFDRLSKCRRDSSILIVIDIIIA